MGSLMRLFILSLFFILKCRRGLSLMCGLRGRLNVSRAICRLELVSFHGRMR